MTRGMKEWRTGGMKDRGNGGLGEWRTGHLDTVLYLTVWNTALFCSATI